MATRPSGGSEHALVRGDTAVDVVGGIDLGARDEVLGTGNPDQYGARLELARQDNPLDAIGVDDDQEPKSHVERARHLCVCDPPQRGEDVKDRRTRKRGGIQFHAQPVWHQPARASQDAAAGHMRRRFDAHLRHQRQHRRDIQRRRLQQHRPDGGLHPRQRLAIFDPRIGQHAANQRKAVGMHPICGQSQHDIASRHIPGRHARRIDQPNGKPRQIKVARPI